MLENEAPNHHDQEALENNYAEGTMPFLHDLVQEKAITQPILMLQRLLEDPD